MNVINNEDYAALEKYEVNFRHAIYSNFVSMKSSDFTDFAEIYAHYFPALNRNQMTCNTCRLNALKKLGQLYFENKEQREKQAEDTKTKVDDKTEAPVEKKKAGRPKKMDVE